MESTFKIKRRLTFEFDQKSISKDGQKSTF